MRLTELFVKKAIVPRLKGEDRKQIIQELLQTIKKAYATEKFSVPDTLATILGREKLGSTGLGGGVAIPHTKVPGLSGSVGAFGRTSVGIDFNAVDGEKVTLVFMILSPSEKPELHQVAVQKAVGAIKRPNFCKFLRNAKTTREIEEIFREIEEPLKV